MSPPKYYDLPNLWTPKGTSLGYGKKIDLAKQNIITPSPGDYEIKSAFNKSKNEGITMSQGRD